ncbi:MAG TPA: hypothetical protein VM577_08635 [Anaerovoracaceae bacterium]|nr:hypothetical protein [Anaerovoracaceae bacterium]
MEIHDQEDLDNKIESNEEEFLSVYEIPDLPEQFAKIVYGYENEPHRTAAHGIRDVLTFCDKALDPESGLEPANFFQILRDLAVLHLAAMNDVIEAKQQSQEDTSQ